MENNFEKKIASAIKKSGKAGITIQKLYRIAGSLIPQLRCETIELAVDTAVKRIKEANEIKQEGELIYYCC